MTMTVSGSNPLATTWAKEIDCCRFKQAMRESHRPVNVAAARKALPVLRGTLQRSFTTTCAVDDSNMDPALDCHEHQTQSMYRSKVQLGY